MNENEEKHQQEIKRKNENGYNTLLFYLIPFIVLLIALIFMKANVVSISSECENYSGKHELCEKPTQKIYKVFGKNLNSGYLENVHEVLERFGYENDQNSNDWDLYWAHDYPFRILSDEFRHLKSYQRINHFPGCGYITNKVDLATSNLKYIPPAFKLPEQKKKLLEYMAKKPEATFVQKNNDHRNIIFRNKKELENIVSNSTFVQEFISNPLLINGHKFDVGIYTVITSIDPLRIYIYNGEALLRFCPVKYHPFDSKNLDKYVVGDDYLPTWKVPSLEYFYNELGLSMKESLNTYLKSKGKNSQKIWKQIEDSIRLIVLSKEPDILNVVNKLKFKRNFFEMMRFDFLVDENLDIFLLEANMSPNLSSAHFPPNKLLYQQVLYNILSLVGVGQRLYKDTLAPLSKSEQEMLVSDKNIAVYSSECASMLCKESCVSPMCQLCKPCLSYDTKEYLQEAFREHMDKGDCKRIFPPSINEFPIHHEELENYSPENQLQYKWFKGKCELDTSWC